MSRPVKAAGDRRGNAVVTALVMIPLMGFAALAVDIGMREYGEAQLQVALDAGALAGVARLDGTEDGLVAARTAVVDLVARNAVLGRSLQITGDQVQLGVYDATTETFDRSTDPAKVNAIFVEADVSELPTVFAGVAFGHPLLAIRARALARFVLRPGAGQIPCYIPIAVPDCYLTEEGIQDYDLRMTSANNDNAGWAAVGEDASASAFRAQLTDECSSPAVTTNDYVNLQNGQVSAVVRVVADLLGNSANPWDPVRWGELPPPMDGSNEQGSVSTVHPYGNVIEGPVLVFHPSGGECGSELQFNQSAPIVGVAWGVLYDADDQGSGVNIRMRLDTTWDYTIDSHIGGGVDSNVSYRDINLVY